MKMMYLVSAAAALTLVTQGAAAQRFTCNVTKTMIPGVGTLYVGRDDYKSVYSTPGGATSLNSNAVCADQAFLAAGGTAGYVAGTENFTATGTPNYGLAFDGTIVTGHLTDINGDGHIYNGHEPDEQANNRYAVSSPNYYEDPDAFDVSTSVGVDGFGFFAIDAAESGLGADLTIDYIGTNASHHSFDAEEMVDDDFGAGSDFGSGNLLYIGLLLNPGVTLSSVDFNKDPNRSSDVAGFDDMTILANKGDISTPTSVTPEPAAMSLLATGLVGLAGFTKRRRRIA